MQVACQSKKQNDTVFINMDSEQQFVNLIIAESAAASLEIENARLRTENERLKKKIFDFIKLNPSKDYLDILKK